MEPAEKSRGVLVAWVLQAEVPIPAGAGRRKRSAAPVPDWLDLSPDSSQDEEQEEGEPLRIGPRENDSGQRIEPTEPSALDSDGYHPWQDVRRRTRALVEQARDWSAALRRERTLTVAGLAGREGISQPGVSKVLALLRLPDDLLADLCDVDAPDPVPSRQDLLTIARIKDTRSQRARYREIVRLLRERRRVQDAAVPRQRGVRHLLALARTWRGELDSGVHRSFATLAEAHGVTPQWVALNLALLEMAPDVVAALDVDADQIPAVVTQRKVRAIAKLPTHAAQREAFEALWPDSLADQT